MFSQQYTLSSSWLNFFPVDGLDEKADARLFNFFTAVVAALVGIFEARLLSFLPRAPPLDLEGTVVEETGRLISSSQADSMSRAT